jgi:hypothetical protein
MLIESRSKLKAMEVIKEDDNYNMDMKTLWKDQSLTHRNTNYQQAVIQEKN